MVRFHIGSMATSTTGSTAQSARSWYWMKCAHLGYLQTAPTAGLSTRPMQTTAKKLLEQCAYIFGSSAPLISPARIERFNQKFGAGRISRIVESTTQFARTPSYQVGAELVL